MTDLSITRYAELQFIQSKFVLTQSFAADGTVDIAVLSISSADYFDSMKLLKNDSRSCDRTEQRTFNALFASDAGLLVEVNGIEPMTPCLQSRCSPS